MKKTFVVIVIVILVMLFFWFFARKSAAPEPPKTDKSTNPSLSVSAVTNSNKTTWAAPISNARERIIKKPFGIYVSPGHSPVSPEKFTGYHTGVDFETLPDEQNVDVPVFAVCDGKLIYKNWLSGYGGVAVQSCTLNNQSVTVLYGHLDVSSIAPAINSRLAAGQKIGVLGRGYSTETDGERKHLHLAVHKGAAVNLRGYVQNENELNSWIDFATLDASKLI